MASRAAAASSGNLPSSRKLRGWATATWALSAHCLTGEAWSFMPRPAGRSGWVRTRGMSKPAACSLSRATRANSGVPAKMTRMGSDSKDSQGNPVAQVTKPRSRTLERDARRAASTDGVALFVFFLLDHLGLDAVALERRQVFHKHLAHQMIHFMLDTNRQHAFGLM